MFIKIFYVFLKEEYWIPEALTMKKLYTQEDKAISKEDEDVDNIQALKNLTELWTSVSLYIHAGYQLVSDLPDAELQYVFISIVIDYIITVF